MTDTIRLTAWDGARYGTVDLDALGGTEYTHELGKESRATLRAPRSVVDALDLAVGDDVAELRTDRFGLEFGGRLADVQWRGEQALLTVASYEKDAQDAEPAGDGTGEWHYENAADSTIVQDAIDRVDALEAGTIETVETGLSYRFARVSQAKIMRTVEEAGDGELFYHPDGTVDYVDALGRDRTGTTIGATDDRLMGDFDVERAGDERKINSLVMLGTGEGAGQLATTVTADGFTPEKHALDFDASSEDTVNISGNPADNVDYFAVEITVKPASGSLGTQDRAIVGNWGGGNWALWYDVGGTPGYRFVVSTTGGGNVQVQENEGAAVEGETVTIKAEYDTETAGGSDEARISVDGTVVNTTPHDGSPTTSNTTDWEAGSDNGSHNYWDGIIDEVSIEDGTGEIHRYEFDEGSGTTAIDAAGDNDGTITGATYVDDITPVGADRRKWGARVNSEISDSDTLGTVGQALVDELATDFLDATTGWRDQRLVLGDEYRIDYGPKNVDADLRVAKLTRRLSDDGLTYRVTFSNRRLTRGNVEEELIKDVRRAGRVVEGFTVPVQVSAGPGWVGAGRDFRFRIPWPADILQELNVDLVIEGLRYMDPSGGSLSTTSDFPENLGIKINGSTPEDGPFSFGDGSTAFFETVDLTGELDENSVNTVDLTSDRVAMVRATFDGEVYRAMTRDDS